MKTFSCLVLLATSACALADVSEDSSAPELSTHIRHNFSTRTTGSTQVFSKYISGTVFARNPAFWLRGLSGLTAIQAGYGPGATAITRWHVLEATHSRHDAGSKLYFCDLQDHTVARTVVAGIEIRPDIKSDIWLAVMDEALPPSIVPAALMPAQWPHRLNAQRLPVVAMNQASAMGCAELVSFNQPIRGWFRYGYLYRTAGITPAFRFEPLRAGDSGYPIATVVETNLVLLGHLTFEAGTTNFLGPDYSSYADDIQSAIATLGTNHLAAKEKLTIIDLSRFR